MPLDDDVKQLLALLAPPGAPQLHELGVQEARDGMLAALAANPAPEAVEKVYDRTIPGPAGEIPVRVYDPAAGASPKPVLVYFHGGGWVLCNLDTHDGTCRSLANGADCVVVSVDYRLAPEHKFPAGLEDCHAAAAWVAANPGEVGGDPARIAIGGDSAGGNLTAAVALAARERGGPRLRHQLLIYPVIDHRFDTPSYGENAEGYFLSRDSMRWFWDHYLSAGTDGDDPLASPIRAADLAGLPPATVITAEFDPLRDEGEAYARRLQEAGVPTVLHRYDGVIHGFFGMTEILPKARAAVGVACTALRGSFEG